MSFPVPYTANEPAVLRQHQQEAIARMDVMRDLCDAAANQPYTVQAEVTRDMLDAMAVCEEWGVKGRSLNERCD